MPADSLHVTQMKGFTPPETDRPQTVWHLQEVADRAAARAAKKEEQSSPDAAVAEQENAE